METAKFGMGKETSEVQVQNICEALSRCQKSGAFTDLTLVCEGESIEVHKVVVCSQSNVLHAACTGRFKEASSGVYEFVGEDKLLIKKMVSYLYTATYDDTKDAKPSQSLSDFQLHARVFALADRYCIDGLMAFCVRKYQSSFFIGFEPIQFIESIPDVYSLTPAPVRNLKEIVISFSRKHIADWLREKSIRTAYDNIVKSVPKFTKVLLDVYIEAPLRGHCDKCGKCSPVSVLRIRCKPCQLGYAWIYNGPSN